MLKKAIFLVPFHSICIVMLDHSNAVQYLQHYFTKYLFLNDTRSNVLFTKWKITLLNSANYFLCVQYKGRNCPQRILRLSAKQSLSILLKIISTTSSCINFIWISNFIFTTGIECHLWARISLLSIFFTVAISTWIWKGKRTSGLQPACVSFCCKAPETSTILSF